MGRENEGIEGFNPARHGRFVAGEYVNANGCDTEKGRSFIGAHNVIHNCLAIQNLSK